MIEVMESLAQDRPNIDLDVYFCFTVREEIGLSGALTAANAISPDFALVLETTAIGDIADTSPEARVADVGGGGVLSLMDRSTIYDRSFVDFLLKTSKENGIKAQIKRYVSGGNDAGSIHKTGVGVRTAALSVPTRYLHSPACVASLDDYEALRDLCEAAVRNFDTKL
jgi:endoglucanase